MPVKKESLAPLLPDGEKLTNERHDLQAVPGLSCNLDVDGTRILYASVQFYKDRLPAPPAPPPDGYVSNYKYGADRAINFRGEEFLGSDGGVINVICDDAKSYLNVVVRLSRSRMDDTPDGYKKLLPFVEDFVPSEGRKYRCTK
ncbi:hypothetical protein ACFYN0_27750 [Streptomyces sp. NPDC006704]|uniref:hypothetical protein n=1 Tax=Streptomyces sp. NPDC006704 TaxID=3364760 RepID=UPI003698E289